MPIEFNCHVCGKLLRTADEKAGRTAKCPGCGEKLTVPGSETEADDEFGADEYGGGDVDDYDDDDEDDFPSRSSGGATRKCPMCGESISRRSTRCEFCGEKIGGGRPRRRRSGIATEKAGPAAIGLMVAAGLGLAWQMFATVVNLLTVVGGNQPGFGGGPQPFGGVLTGGIGLVMNVIGIVVGIVVILGALKMRRLESYGMAMTASIIVMIPCVSPCCLIGIPFGIWSLVVLNDSDVKDAFPG